MHPLPAIDTTELFGPLLGELLTLLRGLDAADWERPTVARGWRVRDVAAHMLDGDLRKLAVYRDGHRPPAEGPIESERDLGRFINGLNASGVAWAARISPRLLTDLIETSGTWVTDLFAELSGEAPAIFPVSWAGEAASLQWMDTGREYTERWHHQAQIRDAVGAPLLLGPQWMDPLLDISVRALPHAYSGIAAQPGTAVTLEVDGETEGTWTIVRDTSRWTLHAGRPDSPDALVRATTDAAWRLLYNALPDAAADPRIETSGAAPLVEPMLRARSVIL